MDHHGEDAQENRSASKDLRIVRAAIRLAQGLVARMGRGSIQLGPVQKQEAAAGAL
jgi:hypothetical protein